VHYWKAIADPSVHPAPSLMPTVHGFLSGRPFWLQASVSAIVVVAALAVMVRVDYMSGFAVAIAGSLLISYHAYTADAVILIPALLIIIEYSRSAWPRYAAFIFASPIPWLLLLKRG
jgi:hypothetical protein